MSKCKDCEVRKFYSRAFDVHFDEKDCPFVCSKSEENDMVMDTTDEAERGKKNETIGKNHIKDISEV